MTAMLAASIEAPRTPAILVIFALSYLGLAIGRVPGLKLNRVGIVLLGVIAMMIFGRISTSDAVSYINWPTILLLFGFFVLSAQLRLSGFYDVIANHITAYLAQPALFLAVLMAAAAGLSAFLNNDIVCYVFAPITGVALLRRGLNPVPFLVGLAVASNIGAAATFIGNAQNLLIGEVAHLNFGRYMLWACAPVLFALVSAYAIIWLMSKNHLQSAPFNPEVAATPAIPYDRPHCLKGLIILVAVIGLLFTRLPREITVLAAAGIHLASRKFRTEELLGKVDWSILVLFMALFVVTGAFESAGYANRAVETLAHGGIDLNAPRNLMLTTAVLSNLINNSAAVMLLLKVVDVSHPVTAYTLALANSFAGCLIVVGSVANLIVVQQARDIGVNISFRDFARLGIPVTLAAFAGLLGWIALVS